MSCTMDDSQNIDRSPSSPPGPTDRGYGMIKGEVSGVESWLIWCYDIHMDDWWFVISHENYWNTWIGLKCSNWVHLTKVFLQHLIAVRKPSGLSWSHRIQLKSSLQSPRSSANSKDSGATWQQQNECWKSQSLLQILKTRTQPRSGTLAISIGVVKWDFPVLISIDIPPPSIIKQYQQSNQDMIKSNNTQNLTNSINASMTVEADKTYSNMSRAMFEFSQRIFNPLYKSYYNEVDV